MFKTLKDYQSLLLELDKLTPADKTPTLRELCRTDLFFLLWYGLGRGDVFNQWLLDRCAEVQNEPNEHLDLWSREHYKDFNVNEPVATPTGWKKHGDLVVGDWVYGSNGEPVKVIALSPRYNDATCYKITFDDGYGAVCGSGHLWEVEYRSKCRIRGTNKRKYREKTVLATHEIAEFNHKSDNRLSIPVAPALLNIEHILPVEPYLMGVWLGDGASACGRITNADLEIWDYIREYGYELSEPTDNDNGLAETRNVYGLMPKLRDACVLSNKHIPKSYAWACERQRRELLQGLMDSDGHCNTRGTATFCNQNEQLSNDVYDLCQSLGLKPSIYRYEGEKKSYWQVAFQAYEHDEPFRIKRKLERCKTGKRKKPRRYIVSVERVATVETSCIQVDADDGIYLVGRNLVPTHNSTIITFGLSIQDILSSHGDNPLPKWNGREATIGIFSATRPLAKGFLRQIKQELEQNETLKELFPDILYKDPKGEASKWSEDDGLVVKRHTNPKESTIEAWGVVDAQPTSKHFLVCVYDDMVTDTNVTTPEMIDKTNRAWELSINLGTEGGHRRYVGTIYHFNDTYRLMKERAAAIPRIYPCTDDGTPTGKPVLKSKDEIQMKYRTMGAYTFAAQMLLNPVSDTLMGFKREWIRYYQGTDGQGMNIYILCDPANEKKKTSDYTVFTVIGLGTDENYYLLDLVRDRLSLTQRADTLFRLHKKYKKYCKGVQVGYEQYGMQADISHIFDKQNRENYRFDIQALGGKMPKNDRIKMLQPIFEQRRFYLLESCFKTDYQGRTQDLIDIFLNQEYDSFPVPVHDDMLDCMARIMDETLGATFPAIIEEDDGYGYNSVSKGSAWAS